MQNLDPESDHQPVVLVLGNKCDLEEDRRVDTETGEEAALDFKAQFAEVSARTGEGVDEVIY